MPFTKSRLQKINDCLDMMSKRLDQIEAQRVCDDAEDDEDELLESGETFPTPQQPFSDSPPEHIHNQPEE